MASKEEIDRLYNAEKVLEEDWVWETAGANLEGEADVKVLDHEATLVLRGWKRRRYGFCLLYKATKVVRRWDDGVHTNPDGTVIDGSHKHYWHPQYEDAMAYEVGDITTDDVDQAFDDFLDECNINHRGSYYRQSELSDQ